MVENMSNSNIEKEEQVFHLTRWWRVVEKDATGVVIEGRGVRGPEIYISHEYYKTLKKRFKT